MIIGVHSRNIAVADKLAIGIVVPGREGKNLFHKPHQVFRLTGKHNGSGFVIAIVKRADTDGVTCRDELLFFAIVKNAGVFGIQHGEHLYAILKVQRKQDLTVTVTAKRVFTTQFPAEFFKAIDFTVTDNGAGIQSKGLHSFRMQAHNRQAVEAENTLTYVQNPGIIGTTGNRSGKAFLKRCHVQRLSAITNNGTHISVSSLKPTRGRAAYAALP